MDFYQHDPESQNQNNFNINYNQVKSRDRIATASLICGILAIPGTITVWLGVIFGIAAIALAIISRLNNGKFQGGAVAGITLGIVFVVISFMMFSVMLKMISNPDLVNYLNEYMNNLTQQ